MRKSKIVELSAELWRINGHNCKQSILSNKGKVSSSMKQRVRTKACHVSTADGLITNTSRRPYGYCQQKHATNSQAVPSETTWCLNF